MSSVACYFGVKSAMPTSPWPVDRHLLHAAYNAGTKQFAKPQKKSTRPTRLLPSSGVLSWAAHNMQLFACSYMHNIPWQTNCHTATTPVQAVQCRARSCVPGCVHSACLKLFCSLCRSDAPPPSCVSSSGVGVCSRVADQNKKRPCLQA